MLRMMIGHLMARTPGGGHFFKATEITPDNVKNLKRIWVHGSGNYSCWIKLEKKCYT
jgi:Glucose dehydrogenase